MHNFDALFVNARQISSKNKCFKWAIPSLFFVYFRSFLTSFSQQKLTNWLPLNILNGHTLKK